MTGNSSPLLETAKDGAVCFVFLLIVFLPLLVGNLGVQETVSGAEKRNLAPRPEWKSATNLKEFTRNYESYYNDNFGLRPSLITWRNYLKFRILGDSPSPKVILGRQDWLFYAGENNEARDYFRNVRPFDEVSLEKWANALISRDEWLRRSGILYVVVFALNKETIYPEFMPPNINRLSNESRLDQLLAHMKKNSAVKIIDLREPLTTARLKYDRLIYTKTDTHWNDLGAFVAYAEIVKVCSEVLPVKDNTLEGFTIEKRILSQGGDLAGMMNTGYRYDDIYWSLKPVVPWKFATQDLDKVWRNFSDFRKPFATEIPDHQAARVVVFRDSFCNNLYPFLAESFSRAVFMSGGFNAKLVEAERPHVVVEEMVERQLAADSPPGDLPKGFKPYKLGTEIVFSTSGNFKQFQTEGLSYAEDKHVWSSGHEVKIRVPLETTANLFLITLKASPFTVPGLLPKQRVKVFTGSVECANWLIDGEGYYRCLIPGKAVHFGVPMELTFQLPDASSPLEQGASRDPRKLAIALKGLVIEKAVPYQFNTPILFGERGNYVNYPHEGLSYPENDYVWTSGQEAKFYLPVVSGDVSDLKLMVKAFPFLAEGKLKEQTVRVSAGGIQFGTWVVNKEGVFECLVPRGAIRDDMLILSFELPNAASPAKLGVSGDQRELAFAMKEIKVSRMAEGSVRPSEDTHGNRDRVLKSLY